MNDIITDILKKTENCSSLGDFEDIVYPILSNFCCECLAAVFTQLDQQLIQRYQAEGWKIARYEPRTLCFMFGAVTFRRCRMKKEGHSSFLPLDLCLGLEARSHLSSQVKEKIAQLCTKQTFRATAEAFNALMPFSISHQTAHHIVQEIGQKILSFENKKAEEKELAYSQKRSVPFLYIEGDGVLITKKKKKGKRTKHLQLHRVTLYEGVDRSTSRHQLIQAHYFSSVQSSAALREKVSRFLNSYYDLHQTIVISNSDGGSGYTEEDFNEMIGVCLRHEHFCDKFHVIQKIRTRLFFDHKIRQLVIKKVKAYDFEGVQVTLETCESRWHHHQEFLAEIEALRAYLQRNWLLIKPAEQRGLPNHFSGGVCEAGHRLYTYRMKKQGRNWTRQGAAAMAAIITAQSNHCFEEAVRSDIEANTSPFIPEYPGLVRAILCHRPQQSSCGAHQGTIPSEVSSSMVGKLYHTFC